jgi:hypothetical protein
MWRFVLVVMGLMVAATVSAFAKELSGVEIKDAIVSTSPKTAKSASGKSFKFQFKSDGTAMRQRSDGKKVSGKWKINGNTICTTWSDIGKRCNTVEKKGGSYEMMSNGKVTATF